MASPSPSSDRVQDLSLRLMTLGVSGLLVACIAFLGWRQFHPPEPPRPAAPPPLAESFPVRPPDAFQTRSLPDLQVLRAPDQVFRCQQGGRTVYSDQACPQGDERVMKVTAAPPVRSQPLQPDTGAASARPAPAR